ncbi:transglycosylase domain-containing protein, partial [Candidatus Riflebacteria bacterium]
VFLGKKDGKNIFGFQHAAKAYFNKDFKNLTEDEFIALVAMIIAPGTFNILHHPEWNKERVARIKKLVSGDYQVKGLMDLYYGKLSSRILKSGVPRFSYFPDYYK